MPSTLDPPTTDAPATPWLTVPQAAARAQCGTGSVYDAIATGKLKAVRLGVRLRVHVEWVDAWLAAAAQLVNPHAPGAAHPFRAKR
jgi:excisionase family DNA binding protein